MNDQCFGVDFIPNLGVEITDKIGSAKQYVAYMIDRMMSFSKWKIPNMETLPERSLKLMLIRNGFSCITRLSNKNGKYIVDLDKGDPYAFFGGLGGVLDQNYMPTICTVSNPYLKFNEMLEIGKDCVIIPNDSLYIGLMPLFYRYANLLAENDVTLRIADINARLISLLTASNDVDKKAAEQYLDDVVKGKMGVIMSKSFTDMVKAQPYAASGTTNNITQLIELQQYYKAGWYNDIGLSANYNMKREAINSSEAQMGEDALLPLAEDMINCQKFGCAQCKRVLNLDLDVEFAGAWKKREEETTETEEETTETEVKENEQTNID